MAALAPLKVEITVDADRFVSSMTAAWYCAKVRDDATFRWFMRNSPDLLPEHRG